MSNCSIVIDDGTNQADLSEVWELGISYGTLAGGKAILRFLDGSAVMQQRWHKETFTVTGRDRVPRDLRLLDFSKELTMTVTTGLGIDVYQCYSLGPNEDWNVTGGEVSWSMELQEV